MTTATNFILEKGGATGSDDCPFMLSVSSNGQRPDIELVRKLERI